MALLRHGGVFVQDVGAVVRAGAVNVVAFDTTGTLLEAEHVLRAFDCPVQLVRSSMDATGSANTSDTGVLVTPVKVTSADSTSSIESDATSVPLLNFRVDHTNSTPVTPLLPVLMQEIIATCHSLHLSPKAAFAGAGPFVYNQSNNVAEIAEGCQLDKDLFKVSGWNMQAPSAGSNFLLAVYPTAPPAPPVLANGPTFSFMTPTRAPTSNAAASRTPNLTSPYSPNTQSIAQKYILLKTFSFTAEHLICSSLVRRPSGEIFYYVKGDPMAVARLCRPDAACSVTLLRDRVWNYEQQGMQVVAVAYRKCLEPLNTLLTYSREQHEQHRDLVFTGLLALSSRVHSTASATVRSLQAAGIHTVLVSGDTPYAALAVAAECQLIGSSDAYSTQGSKHLDIESHASSGTGYSLGSPALPISGMKLIDSAAAASFVVLVDADSNGDLCLVSLSGEPVRSSLISVILEAALWDCQLPGGDQLSTSVLSVDTFSSTSTASSNSISRGKLRKMQLAVTRDGLIAARKAYSPSVVYALIRNTKVFANCAALDKQFIVRQLMHPPSSVPLVALSTLAKSKKQPAQQTTHATVGDDVLFCGQGTQNLLACKAATLSCSASSKAAEASVTSDIITNTGPGFILDVLRVGRTSLVNIYVLGHYNLICGLLLVVQGCCLYRFGLMVSNAMFVCSIAVFQGIGAMCTVLSAPAVELAAHRPPKRYLTTWCVSQLLSQTLLAGLLHWIAIFVLLPQQTWYTLIPPANVADLDSWGWEATVSQNMLLGQFVLSAMTSSIGMPFRQEWYMNRGLLLFLLLGTGWVVFQCLCSEHPWLNILLPMKPFPKTFGQLLLGLLLLNALLGLELKRLVDDLCVDRLKAGRHLALFTPALQKAFKEDAEGLKKMLQNTMRDGEVDDMQQFFGEES